MYSLQLVTHSFTQADPRQLTLQNLRPSDLWLCGPAPFQVSMGAALCFPPAKGPAATHAVGPLCVWAPGHFPGGAHTGRSANSPSETCSHSAGHTVCAQAEAEVLGRGAGVAPCAESPGLTAFWRPCKEAMPPTPKRFERMTPEHVALVQGRSHGFQRPSLQSRHMGGMVARCAPGALLFY